MNIKEHDQRNINRLILHPKYRDIAIALVLRIHSARCSSSILSLGQATRACKQCFSSLEATRNADHVRSYRRKEGGRLPVAEAWNSPSNGTEGLVSKEVSEEDRQLPSQIE
jgi:hypothetical protein